MRIRGAILDELRRMDWCPRRARARARKMKEAINVLEQRLGRVAKEEEIRADLGLSEKEFAKWLERTYAFVPRVGADFLREVIVEDSLGIAAELDARMQDSVDAYKDPWQEGAAPATPGQFRTSLPLEVLPQVPVR